MLGTYFPEFYFQKVKTKKQKEKGKERSTQLVLGMLVTGACWDGGRGGRHGRSKIRTFLNKNFPLKNRNIFKEKHTKSSMHQVAFEFKSPGEHNLVLQ